MENMSKMAETLAQPGRSTVEQQQQQDDQPEAGPSRLPACTTTPSIPPGKMEEAGKAADKWVKPNGPPVGSQFGARLLTEEEDVWGQNAWCVPGSV